MARKVGQWEEEEVAQSHEEEERCQLAVKRRCRVTEDLVHSSSQVPVTLDLEDLMPSSVCHSVVPKSIHQKDVHQRDVHQRDIHQRDIHQKDIHQRDIH
ncbi:hypothetical protein STEG23_013863 [Scotinomys teguina]